MNTLVNIHWNGLYTLEWVIYIGMGYIHWNGLYTLEWVIYIGMGYIHWNGLYTLEWVTVVSRYWFTVGVEECPEGDNGWRR